MVLPWMYKKRNVATNTVQKRIFITLFSDFME